MKKWEACCVVGISVLALGFVLPLWIILSVYGPYKSFLDPEMLFWEFIGTFLTGIGTYCLMYAHIIHKLEEKKGKNHLTPKSFLKKCVECGREIPIASEQCPYCGREQRLRP
jgi:hypothetical protein